MSAPFAALFAQLTEAMGVTHSAYPDVDPSQADRVEWKLKDFGGLEPIGYTIPATVTIGRQAIEYEVNVYGLDEADVLARAGQLAGHLDNLVGPPQGAPPPAGNGYKVGKSSVPARGGDGVSAGFGCVVPVTLYMPVFSEVRPLLTVTHPGIITTALAGTGVGPDALPTWQS